MDRGCLGDRFLLFPFCWTTGADQIWLEHFERLRRSPTLARRVTRESMVKRGLIIGLQIIVAIPTLAATLAAVGGFAMLSLLAGLHNEKS